MSVFSSFPSSLLPALHPGGVTIIRRGGGVIVVEFNELLRQIARGEVHSEDQVVSAILTDCKRRRAGELRLYEIVKSGRVNTEDLPLRLDNGIIATGARAARLLRVLEAGVEPDPEQLLVPVTVPARILMAGQMLRSAAAPEEADLSLPRAVDAIES